MNSDGYSYSAFYFDDYYDADARGRRLKSISIDDLPTLDSWSEDAGYLDGYENKPVFYFPRTRELKIDGASVTVTQEFIDYVHLRNFLESPTEEIGCDSDEPIDLREFLG